MLNLHPPIIAGSQYDYHNGPNIQGWEKTADLLFIADFVA